MGSERERSQDVEQSPDAGGSGGGLAALFGGGGGGRTRSAAPTEEFTTQLIAAVNAGKGKQALQIAGSNPGGAVQALTANSRFSAFLRAVGRNRPFESAERRTLDAIYDNAGSFENKKLVFAARYGVNISETEAKFTEAELDVMQQQASLLPAGQVEGLSTFKQLARKQGQRGGTFGGTSINMKGMATKKEFAHTFRHEVGHAIDAAIGGRVADLRTNKAGWRRLASTSELIGAVGGFKSCPTDVRQTVQRAMNQFATSSRGSFTFANSWESHLNGHLIKQMGAEKAAAKLQEVRKATPSDPVLGAAHNSSGGNGPHYKHKQWQVANGRAFFFNAYYAKPFSVSAETHNFLKSWNNPKANFSDKEWFAEVYAEWFRTSPPGKGRAFPSYVSDFMKKTVETYRGGTVQTHSGQDAASDEGGGEAGQQRDQAGGDGAWA